MQVRAMPRFGLLRSCGGREGGVAFARTSATTTTTTTNLQITAPRPDATKLGVEPCTPALDCVLLWPAMFNCWCARTSAQLDGIGPEPEALSIAVLLS